MLEQEAMISRVRLLCGLDARLVAATTHGSLARGEFSEIETVPFFDASPATLLGRIGRPADACQLSRRGTNPRTPEAP